LLKDLLNFRFFSNTFHSSINLSNLLIFSQKTFKKWDEKSTKMPDSKTCLGSKIFFKEVMLVVAQYLKLFFI